VRRQRVEGRAWKGKEVKDLSDLAPIERAKVHLVVANAAATLFCLLMKTEGIGIEDSNLVQKEGGAGQQVRKQGPKGGVPAQGPGRRRPPFGSIRWFGRRSRKQVHLGRPPGLEPRAVVLLREAGAKRKRQQEEARVKAPG